MRAKLHAKASALGLEDAAYVRMLIFRDVNGVAGALPGSSQAVSTFRRAVTSAVHELPAIEEADAPLEELVPEGEPRAEDMEIPADADGGLPTSELEELLATSPGLLDEMVAASGVAQPNELLAELARPPARAAASSSYRGQINNRGRGIVPPGGPGSRTRPLGVNDQIVGGNTYGDGHGNVLRDNMRHFGFNGTRSR